MLWARQSDCMRGLCVELLCDAWENADTESEPSKQMQKQRTGMFHNRRYTAGASLNLFGVNKQLPLLPAAQSAMSLCFSACSVGLALYPASKSHFIHRCTNIYLGPTALILSLASARCQPPCHLSRPLGPHCFQSGHENGLCFGIRCPCSAHRAQLCPGCPQCLPTPPEMGASSSSTVQWRAAVFCGQVAS